MQKKKIEKLEKNVHIEKKHKKHPYMFGCKFDFSINCEVFVLFSVTLCEILETHHFILKSNWHKISLDSSNGMKTTNLD